MRRSQEREPVFRGEITAFLVMLFVLMLSLVGALLESVSVQMTKNRKRADTILALESAFAEYDRQMLEEYDLFVRNGCNETILEERLTYFGAGNMNHSIQNQERLSDNNGTPFREQAIRYAKNWLGVDASLPDTEYEFYSETYLEEEELVHMDIQEMLAKGNEKLPEEGNPLSSVQRLKNKGLLTLVCENPEELSNHSITVESLPSHRELKAGNWQKHAEAGATDKLFFAAYLTEHFGSLLESKDNCALLYEQEYLLSGYPSDKENLEKVCRQILSIRMVANYGYLLTDTTRKAEAEALALTLCSLLTVPGITEAVKHALLLAWAYGESIVDVRVLLKGKKVPMIKTTETWQLQLANLVKLGTAEEVVSEKDIAGGLSYQNYLSGLLAMERKEALSMRSLDLIESNLQIKIDECVTKVEIQSKAMLRRGVKDTFTTTFEYE